MEVSDNEELQELVGEGVNKAYKLSSKEMRDIFVEKIIGVAKGLEFESNNSVEEFVDYPEDVSEVLNAREDAYLRCESTRDKLDSFKDSELEDTEVWKDRCYELAVLDRELEITDELTEILTSAYDYLDREYC